MTNTIPCQICNLPSVALNLCNMHYKRYYRHGHTRPTRPEDWGRRNKHPLNYCWRQTARSTLGRVLAWDDFWVFVKDVGERPSIRHALKRINKDLPIGPSNFYWKERIENKSKSEYGKLWRKENPLRAKNIDLKKTYGIDIHKYDQMLVEQNHKCAICEKEEDAVINGKKIRLSVDHCHTSKKVRGLLCSRCNHALGYFEDDIPRILKAVEYLRRA